MTDARPALMDLDQLPWPDREALGERWLKPSWQQVHLISSRGCPYDCAFCASGRHGQGVRYFSVDYTLRELEALRARYNPLEIYFFDDLMVVNRRRFLELCRALEERGLHQGVVFRAYARVDLLDEELADWFARCNFRRIDFGFESNSQQVLEYLNKRRATPEKNQQAIDLLRERHLSVGANMIVGSRPESYEDALESVRFIERNREALDRLSVAVMTLIPGTRIWDEAVERGVVDENLDWSLLGFNSWPEEKQDLANIPLMLEAMTREELGELYRRFQDLAREINARGEARFWTEQFQNRQARAAAVESELSQLKGSRLVRAALSVRRFLRGSS